MFVSFPSANMNINNFHRLYMISKDLETSGKLLKYENPFAYGSFFPPIVQEMGDLFRGAMMEPVVVSR